MILFRTNRNNVFVAFLLFVCTTGMARAAGHFVRLIILAALGLLGMWMVHTLALDYQSIRKGLMFARQLLRLKRDIGPYPMIGDNQLYYRTIKEDMLKDYDKQFHEKIDMDNINWNWNLILQQDPKHCVKSFFCQISAANATKLTKEELSILEFAKATGLSKTWDSAINETSSRRCRLKYRQCPFEAQTMMNLLRVVSF